MEPLLRYRGREVSEADAASIRALIASRPEASRRALSFALCEQWDWVQANGAPRDAVCRGLMLALHRAGHIELPPPRWASSGAASRDRRPARVDVDMTSVRGPLSELGELEVAQVRRTEDEALLDSLIDVHHYLGFTRPVGEHLKFLVRAAGRPLACLVWSSAPRHLAARDRYIGWSPEVRRHNLRLLSYNSRFLILPWVQVPHLASHLLARMTRMLPTQWEAAYGHPVWFAETFVDPTRFGGTCYRAANWVRLGSTTGRGKDDQTGRANRTLKDVWGLGLCRRFRERLLAVTP